MNESMNERLRQAKRQPEGITQHVTAGPYSPVLEVDARRIVVISGQVAVAPDGSTIGVTIEEQTRATLANCERLLVGAGSTLADVFKVNVYLRDLAEWDAFNAIYRNIMPEPWPARTAIQAVLLPEYRVEVEMWSVKQEE